MKTIEEVVKQYISDGGTGAYTMMLKNGYDPKGSEMDEFWRIFDELNQENKANS